VRLRRRPEHGLRGLSLVTEVKYPNIYSLFCDRVEHYRRRDIFYVREEDGWRGISWEGFDREARAFASALIARGLEKGRAVAILMGNVPAWAVSDLGTIIAGGVSVGLYPTSSAKQCQYIIDHSDAEFVLVDRAAQLEKILRVRDRLPKVRWIIVLDEGAAGELEGVVSYREFLALGAERLTETGPVMEERALHAGAEETVHMVYTSGTTGLPKGACLSHRYVINSVESLLAAIPTFDSDTSFSYLPFCHVAERISGFYTRLYAGAACYFVEDPAKLWDYMREVRPTVFPSLPRFFEKVYARAVSDLDGASAEERGLFEEVLGLGKRVVRLRERGERVPAALAREYAAGLGPIRDRIKGYFGGRIRLATSGGAPLPQEIAEFFAALGLPVLQAYGLTENLCVAFNREERYKLGTVGPPMPGCRVRIAEDGEILVRSEMMFSGYYKEPEKSAEMFRDGWLLTGDLGEMDADGFLKITGRKKELIVTSTGKNIAPALVENLLKEHHLISQALVYGDGKSYLVALITLNALETESYARAHSISYQDFAGLTRSPEIKTLVQSLIDKVNERVSSTEAIRKFAILDHDFSIEAEEITPTMKIKRKVVTERYGDILEGLYA
jgi:long-chain acyl-CoA synthetase